MIPKPTTWGDVWPYAYIQDKAGQAWKIVEEKSGWLLLENQAGQQVSQLRPADDVPVTMLLLTEQQAFGALYRAFPGAQIIDIQQTGA